MISRFGGPSLYSSDNDVPLLLTLQSDSSGLPK